MSKEEILDRWEEYIAELYDDERIRLEISEEQYGFMQDKGTRNAIFILRIFAEGAIEMQEDVYICFVDYSKAFDRVKHKDLMQIMIELDKD